jgi:4-hydroxybenzoate polyprenyltransferase
MERSLKIASILHALFASTITLTLLTTELISNPFWLVVILCLTWFLWLPYLVKKRRLATACIGFFLLVPSFIVTFNLLGIAYG